MKKTFRLFLISICAISIALFYTVTPIWADGDMIGVGILSTHEETIDFWTPERLRNTKPLPMPTVDGELIEEIEPDFDTEEIEGEDGHAPALNPVADETLLFEPLEQDTDLVPEDRGSYRRDYSSSRVVPLSADRSYPYRVNGRLWFRTRSGGTSSCSASIGARRLVYTAGHCVYTASARWRGWHSRYVFIPAYRDGNAPFRRWTARWQWTTSAWVNGGGGVPNAADLAILEMNDQSVGRIGNWLGWLGWQTNSLWGNHLKLGWYPCNLDSCRKMHQVDSQSARIVSRNNVEYGSDMRGGSSGGAWVMNFGSRAVGQPCGTSYRCGMNRMVGITSWGYVSTGPKVQGSSTPGTAFVNMRRAACVRRSGNC